MFLREQRVLQGSTGCLLCGAAPSPWAYDVAATWQSCLNVILWEGLFPHTPAFARGGTKPSSTFPALMSGDVFSHTLCETSPHLNPCFLFPDFWAQQHLPGMLQPSALEQTSTQLTAAPGHLLSLPEVPSKGPWIAFSRVIPLEKKKTSLYSYSLGLHRVWEWAQLPFFFFFFSHKDIAACLGAVNIHITSQYCSKLAEKLCILHLQLPESPKPPARALGEQLALPALWGESNSLTIKWKEHKFYLEAEASFQMHCLCFPGSPPPQGLSVLIDSYLPTSMDSNSSQLSLR